MNGSSWAKIFGVAVVLILLAWSGYSWWVGTLDDRHADVHAVLQIADEVAPGAPMQAQVVVGAEDGEPKADEPVKVYVGDDETPIAEGTTDEAGLFVADVEAPQEEGDVQVRANIGDRSDEIGPQTRFRVLREYSVLVQTDKPRYQPGQDIEIRGIARQLGAEPVEDEVSVQVEDPEGTLFYDRKLETNRFGMVQTTFPVADVAQEGTYRIRVEYEDASQVREVEVEQYTLPQFEVSVDPRGEAFAPGETFEVDIEAEYFFGEPVAGGQFEIEGASYVGEMETFETIEGQLDDEGRAVVEMRLPDYFVAASDDDQLGLATVQVDVTDDAGDEETTVEELTVSDQQIIVEAIPAGGKLVVETKNDVWITTRTPEGLPIAATVEITTQDGEELTVETDENGFGAVQVKADEKGRLADQLWDVSARSGQPVDGDESDRIERKAETEISFSSEELRNLGLVVERAEYEVGDTVAAELVASRSDGNVYVELAGGGRVHSTKTVELEDHHGAFDFDVDPEMVGMLEIRAWTITDGGNVTRTAALVPVGDAEALEVALAPSADEFRPGESVQFEVQTREDGEAVEASVGLDVVDEAVFAVGGDDREELMAAHFGVERDLLEPTAWMYTGVETGAEPPQEIEYTCGMAYADVEPTTALDSRVIDSIRDFQRKHAERNTLLALFFLLMIPLAFLAWVFAHRDRTREPLEKANEAVVGLVAMVIVAVGVFLVFVGAENLVRELTVSPASSDNAMIGVALVLFVAIPGVSLWIARNRVDRRFLAGLAAIWGFWVAIMLTLLLWQDAFSIQQTPASWGDSIAVVYAGVGFALATTVGRWLKENRWLDALGPAIMGAVGLMVGAMAAVEQQMVVPAVLFWLAAIVPVWIALHGDGKTPMTRRLRAMLTGAGATVAIALIGVVIFGLTADAQPGEILLVSGAASVLAWFYVSCAVASRDDGASFWGIVAGAVGLFVLTALLGGGTGLGTGGELLLGVAIVVLVVSLMYLGGRALVERRYLVASGLLVASASLVVSLTLTGFGILADQKGHETVEAEAVDRFAEQEDAVAQGGGLEMMGGGGAFPESEDDEEIAVREYFPETLFSDIVITGEDGAKTVDLEMADSITNWKIDATAVSASGAMGTAVADATVFQPFFIEPQLPVSLTQGDRVVVPVSVFNYSDETLDLTVELTGDDWFRADRRTARLQLPPNSVDAVDFEVEAVENGEHTIQWEARAGEGDDLVGDAVRRDVEVEPEGRQHTEVISGQLDGDTSHDVDIPAGAVAGSETAVVQLNPGMLGELVDGIDALLRMPTGCFEQTSSALYPNVMALAYMDQAGTTQPEIEERAERYIAEGYQRILGFEVGEGGYSLFGNAPASHSITAYGLRLLSDTDEVYSVDQRVLDGMYDYVVRQQTEEGYWEVDRNADYAVGIDDKLGLTAFIGWSLAQHNPDSAAVTQSVKWVVSQLYLDEADTRQLAVVLNLLVAAGAEDGLQEEIADELAARVERDGSVAKWPGEGAGRTAQTGTVENTALATQALVESGRYDGYAQAGMAYLVEARTDRGWGTTQATVAALEALVAGEAGGEPATEGEVVVRQGGESVWSLDLEEHSGAEAHITGLDLGPGASTIDIEAPEESGFLYRVETRYHLPWDDEDEEEELQVEVDYDRTELTVDDRVEVTASLEAKKPVGMALVEVGVPPGFDVDGGSLDVAVRRGEISDWESTERRVTLYVEDVDGPLEASFDIVAAQPIEASSGSSSVYDYYAPEREAEAGPVQFVVQ